MNYGMGNFAMLKVKVVIISKHGRLLKSYYGALGHDARYSHDLEAVEAPGLGLKSYYCLLFA